MNMIIKCQEHYDKVVEYAKSIGDNTLQQCIEQLQQWEKNSNGKYEIELYWDDRSRRRGTLSWQTGRIIRRDAQSVPWMEHTHLKIKPISPGK